MNEHTKTPRNTNVDEGELGHSLERGERQPVCNFEDARNEARRHAEATVRKDRRTNACMTEGDMRNLKVRAAEEGVGYQTLS